MVIIVPNLVQLPIKIHVTKWVQWNQYFELLSVHSKVGLVQFFTSYDRHQGTEHEISENNKQIWKIFFLTNIIVLKIGCNYEKNQSSLLVKNITWTYEPYVKVVSLNVQCKT